jgi:dihydroorotase-like cyclic amidohydrolase
MAIASMIATGSFSAMRGSTTTIVDLENSASMILTVDAGSVKAGNFTDVILIAGVGSIVDVILTVDAGSGKTMIGAGAMGEAKVMAGVKVMSVITADGRNV